ncbi:MAG: glycerophosphodiester phosphodiesterase family protein [Myxococcota bacterium]|nr:glycerophosphodiester phosphodiesterase family protein [Myxococcota bacterium]
MNFIPRLPLALSFTVLTLHLSCSQGAAAPSGVEPSEQVASTSPSVQLGPRPFFLAERLPEGALRDRLLSCTGPFATDRFSIGHRGAPLQFPEHTEESYRAAARMGAGILECDVTFTSDRELVCRHSQCDLHTTTDILRRPELAAKCRVPFQPADPESGTPATAECCTSDIRLEEFKSLCGKMDGFNPLASTVDEFLNGTPSWRTDLYTTCGTLLTHRESLKLFQELDVAVTPELKSPMVEMPYQGDFTQAAYATALIRELEEAGVPPSDAYPQSFNPADIEHWIQAHPTYGEQAIFLDGRSRSNLDPNDSTTWVPTMEDLVSRGVRTLAPPIWMLATATDSQFQPTAYGKAARAAGLNLVTWTLERSGQPSLKEDWYYFGLGPAMHSEGQVFALLDMLDRELDVVGVFSDWPATTTFFANCSD